MKSASSVSDPRPILFLKIDSCACTHIKKKNLVNWEKIYHSINEIIGNIGTSDYL